MITVFIIDRGQELKVDPEIINEEGTMHLPKTKTHKY